jgi:hypothetical protein
MVYRFDFADAGELALLEAEGGGEEVVAGGGRLFVHRSAFMKVLGSTVDYDGGKGELFFVDKEGNRMDPNH